MPKLADAYLGFDRRPSSAVLAPADIEALERSLAALWARGRAAHPQIAVEDVVFAGHLGRCDAPVAVAGADVHAEDLYLCCAGLLGDEVALRTLRANARPVVADHLRRIDASPAFVDEVEQRLWDSALVGSGLAPARLESYAGKGPLAGWLGVVAQRVALTMRRKEASKARAVEVAGGEARLVAGDPELAFIKGYLRGFERAISEGLQALDERERMVYRLHVVDGLSLERIGETYGVSQSTVSGWMAGARSQIVAEAQRLLRDELHASAEDYETMSRLLVSQLDLSVSRLLRQSS